MKPYQKTIIFFLSILILLFLPISTAETNETDAVNQIPYTGNGSGTIENPYQITTVEQLKEVCNHMNSSFLLMNDLDFAEAGITNWTPIGREKELYEAFTGNFDGNNKTIYNMATNSPEDANFGLFYQIAKGTVCNLNFENATVSFGEFYGGILTAMIGPDSTVENCHISNSSVNGSPWCGILSGHIHNSTIRNCTVSNSVLNASAGGIIVSDNKGNVTDSHVDNCTLITAGGGGITGHNSYGGNVKNCSVTDTIIQTELSAGGISGSDWNGKIENCYSANVTITAKKGDTPYGGAATLGGIVGNIRGSKIENCYTTAALTSKIKMSYLGGIVGESAGSRIGNCIAANEKIDHYNSSLSLYFMFKKGKIAGTGTDSVAENCYYWNGIKSNKIIFNGENGKRVSEKAVWNTFPNGVWEEWDTEIWTMDEETGLPILKNEENKSA